MSRPATAADAELAAEGETTRCPQDSRGGASG